MVYDGDCLTLRNVHRYYPDLDPGQAEYPVNNWAFRIDADPDCTGTFSIDGEVEWDQGTAPYEIPDAFNLIVEPAPWLAMPNDYDFGVVEPGVLVTYTLPVRNHGTGVMNVTNIVTSHPDDTSASPTSFSVSPGDPPQEVEISIDTTGMAGRIAREVQVVTADDVRPFVDEEKRLTITGYVDSNVPVYQVSEGGDENPDISGSWIVWEDYRNGNADIYAYNLVTETELPIAAGSAAQRYPRVNGNLVVWLDDRNWDGVGEWNEYDIYGYNLDIQQEFPVTTDPAQEYVIGVDDGKVAFTRVYHEFPEPSYYQAAFDLYVYDYSSGSIDQITHHDGSPYWSVDYNEGDFGNGTLVWQEMEYYWDTVYDSWRTRNDRLQIAEMVSGSVQVLDTLNGNWYDPDDGSVADNGRVVWSHSDGNGDEQVWMWENDSVTQITTEPDIDHGDEFLAIGEDFIVYNKWSQPGLYYGSSEKI